MALRRHIDWMATDEAIAGVSAVGCGLVEPLFAILKNQLGAQQFTSLKCTDVNVNCQIERLLASSLSDQQEQLWWIWRARTAACSKNT